MLYKKVHRQFLRQFWKGRKFKYNDSGDISEVTRGPYIEECRYISTDRWYLITLTSGKMTGVLHDITWLD